MENFFEDLKSKDRSFPIKINKNILCLVFLGFNLKKYTLEGNEKEIIEKLLHAIHSMLCTNLCIEFYNDANFQYSCHCESIHNKKNFPRI